MVRIGLTLYLTIATVVGPWLCCCSVGHCPLIFGAEKPSATVPVPHSCCGHGATPSGDPIPDDEQVPGSPSPTAPHGPCPCKDGQWDLSVPVTQQRSLGVESGEAVAGLSPFEAGKLLAAWSVDRCDLGGAHGEPITFPFSSCRDILRALQILRC